MIDTGPGEAAAGGSAASDVGAPEPAFESGPGEAAAGGLATTDVGAPEAAFESPFFLTLFAGCVTMLAVEVVITRKRNNQLDPDLWHKTNRTW